MRRYACIVCDDHIEADRRTGRPISYAYCFKHRDEGIALKRIKKRVYDKARMARKRLEHA